MTRPAPPDATLGHAGRPSRAKGAWYATDLDFQAALIRDLDTYAEFRDLVTNTLHRTGRPGRRRRQARVWVFTHHGLDVPGRPDPVPVSIEFHEQPNYPTYALEAWEFPAVFADPGAESKHRHGNDALCLWFPGDPAERRWHYTDGLVALFNLARNHLFYEAYWRATGGHGGSGQAAGTWLGDEAAHGYLEALAEVS